jgi:transposase
MPTTPLLPLPEGLEILAVSQAEQGLQIRVTSNRLIALCPRCGAPSQAIHSYYRRKPLELPCAGQIVRLELIVKKFFCCETSCPQKIFAERLSGFLEPYSRLTSRLRVVVSAIAGAFNAKAGARLGEHLGIHFSRMTYLRSLLSIVVPPVGQVKQVGIDDFAWKRGKSYGTVVVDLASHAIIDVLPDREAATVAKWLEDHQEIEVVSRDRGGNYLDGATQGAPQAVQCADRWHLCANVGEAVEHFLIRTQTQLPQQEPREPSLPSEAPAQRPLSSYSATPAQQGRSQARLMRKWKVYQRVKELYAQGLSLRKIGEELGLARNTVRKYFRQPPEPPLPTPRPFRESLLDPYSDYLLERLSQGCRNAAQLFREIQDKGFTGSLSITKAYVRFLQKSTASGKAPRTRKQRAEAISPRELRWLLTRKREKLDKEEQARLDQLLTVSTEVQTVHTLVQGFLSMVRERKGQQLRAWMEEATRSGIAEMKSFVAGIERDYDAVKTGLTLPWSQGPVEGAVNKIKTHKRLMYGRAGFRLLRQKMLHQVGSP